MMQIEDHSHDGFVFRKTTFPGRIGSWEVYWDDWVSVGTYNKDETFEEIVSQWPGTKKEIIQDRIEYR
jgi:hypothetical protein